jgi:hypothetical protein
MPIMFALPQKADIGVPHRHVCFGPESDKGGQRIWDCNVNLLTPIAPLTELHMVFGPWWRAIWRAGST